MHKLSRTLAFLVGCLALMLLPDGSHPARSAPNPAAAPAQGSLWQRYALSGSDLQAVDALDAHTAWAVGTDGLLARWDGTAWTAYDNTELGPRAFNGLDMLAADAGWAVASRDIVARWDGTAWVAE